MDMTLELNALLDKIIQCDVPDKRVAWQGLLIQRIAAATDRTARTVLVQKCCRRFNVKPVSQATLAKVLDCRPEDFSRVNPQAHDLYVPRPGHIFVPPGHLYLP